MSKHQSQKTDSNYNKVAFLIKVNPLIDKSYRGHLGDTVFSNYVLVSIQVCILKNVECIQIHPNNQQIE